MLLEGKVDSVRGVFQRFLNQKPLTATTRTNLQRFIEYRIHAEQQTLYQLAA